MGIPAWRATAANLENALALFAQNAKAYTPQTIVKGTNSARTWESVNHTSVCHPRSWDPFVFTILCASQKSAPILAVRNVKEPEPIAPALWANSAKTRPPLLVCGAKKRKILGNTVALATTSVNLESAPTLDALNAVALAREAIVVTVSFARTRPLLWGSAALQI